MATSIQYLILCSIFWMLGEGVMLLPTYSEGVLKYGNEMVPTTTIMLG